MRVRRRFWAEVVMALVTAGLAGLTLIERDWLEPFIGEDLDHGSGALEVVAVLVCLAITVSLSGVAWLEWRRPRSEVGA